MAPFERIFILEDGNELKVLVTEGTGVYNIKIASLDFSFKMYNHFNRDGRFNYYNVDPARMPQVLKKESTLRKALNEMIEMYIKQ